MGQPIVNVVADGQTGDQGAEFAAGIATATAAQAAEDARVAEAQSEAAQTEAAAAMRTAASVDARLDAIEGRLDLIEAAALVAVEVAAEVADEVAPVDDGMPVDEIEAAGGPEVVVAAGDVTVDTDDKPKPAKRTGRGDWWFGNRPND